MPTLAAILSLVLVLSTLALAALVVALLPPAVPLVAAVAIHAGAPRPVALRHAGLLTMTDRAFLAHLLTREI